MSIIFNEVSFQYPNASAKDKKVLDHISFKIDDGECVGMIGRTGSGKSTLIQHMNGLLRATEGEIYYRGQDIYDKSFQLSKLRGEVGIVFQYPDYQLFEDTVFQDVCFGPLNLKMSRKDAELHAFSALEKVRFPKELFYQSPFSLSGGEKRKAAIAGVLAMNPKVLILDEPAAGLDPQGKKELFEILGKIRKEDGITLIFVSHSMDDIAEYAERVIVLDEGKIFADGDIRKIFYENNSLEKIGLDLPVSVKLVNELKERGIKLKEHMVHGEEVLDEILSQWKKRQMG